MDPRTFVEHIVSIGERYAMGVDNMKALTLKLVTLSMKYVDRKSLWTNLFKEDYVHWDLVERHATNVVGDATVWLSLLQYLSWPDMCRSEGEISSIGPLSGMKKNLRECFLDPGGDQGWNMACGCFILCNVKGLPSLNLVELLTCQCFKRNTKLHCMDLLSRIADSPFTPEKVEEALCFILERAQVDTAKLNQNLAIIRASKEDKKLCLQMKSMVAVQGRPRLRDRVKNLFKTDEHKTQVDISLNTWESYTGFCYLHSFPPTLSDTVKTRLYFLASQTRWDWKPHLKRVLPSGGSILEKVALHPVSQPDLSTLIKVVDSLSMDGCPPFQEMTEFRSKCFQSFPVSHTQTMTLTSVLQLYVAAYQNPEVWKEIWKHCVGVISVQIIKDCESFTNSTPFSGEAVMRLMCRSI